MLGLPGQHGTHHVGQDLYQAILRQRAVGQLKDSTNQQGYSIDVLNTGVIHTWWGTVGGASDSLDTTATYSASQWTLVTFVHTGMWAGIYLNGQLSTSKSTSTSIVRDTGAIARFGGHQDWWFHGLLDEVRIYNRALTADEIKNFVETTTWDYDLGKVLTQTGVNGSSSTVTYTYDVFGRPVKVIKPSDNSTYPTVKYLYNDWGTIEDQNVEVQSRTSDAYYQWQKFFFDGIGRIVESQSRGETDGGNNYTMVSTKTYNDRGLVDKEYVPQKVHITSPGLQTPAGLFTQYEFDGLGNLTNQTDAKDQELKFVYDALNRMTAKQEWNGSSYDTLATYSYDAYSASAPTNYGKGLRTGVGYGSSLGDSDSIKYDSRGRVIQEVRDIDDTTYTTGYTYDSSDRLVTVTYPDAEEVTQEYNGRGLPDSLMSSSYLSYVDSAKYNNLGQITDMSLLYWTASQTFGYWGVGGTHDNSNEGYYGRLWESTSYDSMSDARQDVNYTWDAGGNLTQRATVYPSAQTENFSYDFLDRLTGTSGAYSHTYAYNAIGNIAALNGTLYTYGSKPPCSHPGRLHQLRLRQQWQHDGPRQPGHHLGRGEPACDRHGRRHFLL